MGKFFAAGISRFWQLEFAGLYLFNRSFCLDIRTDGSGGSGGFRVVIFSNGFIGLRDCQKTSSPDSFSRGSHDGGNSLDLRINQDCQRSAIGNSFFSFGGIFLFTISPEANTGCVRADIYGVGDDDILRCLDFCDRIHFYPGIFLLAQFRLE